MDPLVLDVTSPCPAGRAGFNLTEYLKPFITPRNGRPPSNHRVNVESSAKRSSSGPPNRLTSSSCVGLDTTPITSVRSVWRTCPLKPETNSDLLTANQLSLDSTRAIKA